ncbi:hypothetical protein FAM23852_000884 [Propionibacterium freudenreichii]|uniref:hypothetical protein n=1 Tax=Propionibacterium freudenreichii TaxID=1744 RepID=UPI0025500006|nr:hypothetical protein [Propionibacterium freudenreichii]MDK9321417.1 hypothetical protein [Propionibacterium freudenreichii]MDK9323867.1 hypothetical protein [Propionibacterium freudenreichii]
MHDLIGHVMSNPLLALGTIVAAFGLVVGVLGAIIGAVRLALKRGFYAGPARALLIAGFVLFVPGVVLMGAYAILK